MAENIQALIWDFGGVLLRTEDQAPRRAWEQKLNLQPGELHDLVFHGPASRRATLGKASTEEIWQTLGEQLGLEGEELKKLETNFWAGDVLDRALIDATRALKEYIKTALLSNAWPDLRPYLVDDLKVCDAFDRMVISAEVGTAKPGHQIYHILLDQLGIEPQDSLFIDDSSENIQVARDLGMHAILFQTREQMLEELRGLLPAHLAAFFSE
ncbi:MAG: HAD family phosphatase [Anaerolineales bacterium]|jgi:putative hydrolase of the HAD superfamily